MKNTKEKILKSIQVLSLVFVMAIVQLFGFVALPEALAIEPDSGSLESVYDLKDFLETKSSKIDIHVYGNPEFSNDIPLETYPKNAGETPEQIPEPELTTFHLKNIHWHDTFNFKGIKEKTDKEQLFSILVGADAVDSFFAEENIPSIKRAMANGYSVFFETNSLETRDRVQMQFGLVDSLLDDYSIVQDQAKNMVASYLTVNLAGKYRTGTIKTNYENLSQAYAYYMFSVRKDYTTAINDMSADEASTSFALPVNAFDPEANIGSGWLGCGENRDQALSSNGFSTCAKYTYYRFTKRINNNYYGATQVVVTTTPTYYPTSVSYNKTAQVRFYSDALKFYNTSGIYIEDYTPKSEPQVRQNNFSAGISGTGKGIGGFSFQYGVSTTTSDLSLDNMSSTSASNKQIVDLRLNYSSSPLSSYGTRETHQTALIIYRTGKSDMLINNQAIVQFIKKRGVVITTESLSLSDSYKRFKFSSSSYK